MSKSCLENQQRRLRNKRICLQIKQYSATNEHRKQILYRSIRKAQLAWEKLEELLLDIKVNLNNRQVT